MRHGFLLFLLLTTITLGWSANQESDLAGYRVFCRLDGLSYDYDSPAWEGTTTGCSIDLRKPGTYFFVTRAFDTSGNESPDSDEVSYTWMLHCDIDKDNDCDGLDMKLFSKDWGYTP